MDDDDFDAEFTKYVLSSFRLITVYADCAFIKKSVFFHKSYVLMHTPCVRNSLQSRIGPVYHQHLFWKFWSVVLT